MALAGTVSCRSKKVRIGNSFGSIPVVGITKTYFTQFYRWEVFIFLPDLYNIPQAGGLDNESN